MEALILSCKTGGGHNAAALALRRALEERGHSVTLLDPYTLTGTDALVGGAYVRTVQTSPKVFGFVYYLGNQVRKIPLKSPVYAANFHVARQLGDYLRAHPADVVFMTHLFPAEMLTRLKRKHFPLPPTVFISTDYVCTPFTEETECDYYIVPCRDARPDCIARGIPERKLLPLGIPVDKAFSSPLSREEAVRELGYRPELRYVLLCGGSMGSGHLEAVAHKLAQRMETDPQLALIAVCGSRQELYARMAARYRGNDRVTVLPTTRRMPLLLRCASVYMTKPGGLSSTEAAVAGTALVHLSPIPGCETRNMAYFSQTGMSLALDRPEEQVLDALDRLAQPGGAEEMIRAQRAHIPHDAAEAIAKFAEELA